MSTIVTRSGKGSLLTNNEVDANFTNLNNDKYEISSLLTNLKWIPRAITSGYAWRGMAWDGFTYVAINSNTGGGAQSATSPDGVSWYFRSVPAVQQWMGLAYGNNTFVSVSIDGGATTRAMTSTDGGVTWVLRTTPAGAWISVAYGAGLFVAVTMSSTGNAVMTSPDGISWTVRTLPVVSQVWSKIMWSGSYFHSVSNNTNNYAIRSSDGILWEAYQLPLMAQWTAVGSNGSRLCAISVEGHIATSDDNGMSWTQRTPATADLIMFGIEWNGKIFIIVTANGNVMISADGITWSNSTAMPTTGWYGLLWNGTRLIAYNYLTTSRVSFLTTIDYPL